MTRIPLAPSRRLAPAVTLVALGAAVAVAATVVGSDRATDAAERTATERTVARSAMDGTASPITDALASVDEDVRIFDIHVTTLANPYMEGRNPGEAGMERAKDYFEYHLEKFGLEPAFPTEGSGVNGSGLSYRQPFDLGGTLAVTRSEMAGLAGGRAWDFESGDDFTVLGVGGSGEVTAGITFVGYGIDNGPDGWSSFEADTDLTGEIAVMLRFEPTDAEGGSAWVENGWSRRAGFGNKVRSVVDRGAEAIIILNPPGVDDPRAGRLMREGSGGGGGGAVPVIMMDHEAAATFFAEADAEGRSLEDLRAIANEGGQVVPMDGVVSLAATLERDPLIAENVGGLLRGKGDLADEYIVIGAHLDHLGLGYFGSRRGSGDLHPGADDNASGSAGILLMAQRMAERWEEMGDTPRRSILITAFSGEESGLNGSRAYVNDPIAPLADHVLMMNFDMIGRITNGRVSVSGGNTAEGFGDWLQPYFDENPLTVVVPEQMSGASDHTSFFRRQIPVLFAIIADFHDDYHTPDDQVWKINRVGATHASRLFMDIAMDYAQVEEALPFAGEGGGQARRRAAASASASADEGGDMPTRASIRVRFGVRPALNESESGISIESVTEGGSADLAGVQAGDRLVRWDGRKLESVQDWMLLLAGHDPGDEVRIGVMRDGEEVTLTVTLQAADG